VAYAEFALAHDATSSGFWNGHSHQLSPLVTGLFAEAGDIKAQITELLRPYLVDSSQSNSIEIDSLELQQLVDAYTGIINEINAVRAGEVAASFSHARTAAWAVFGGIVLVLAMVLALAILPLSRANRESRILAEIGRTLTASPDVEDVYRTFARLVAELVPFDRLVIDEHDPDTSTISRRFVAIGDSSSPPTGKSFSYEESVVSLAYDRHIDSFLLDEKRLEDAAARLPEAAERWEQGFRSLVNGPFVWEGRLMGSLSLWSRSQGAYGERERDLVARIASHAVGAIANDRLREEEAILAEMGRAITSSDDFDDVYHRFFDLVARLIKFDRVVVSEYDHEAGVSIDRYLWNVGGVGDEPGLRNPLEHSPLPRFQDNGAKGYRLDEKQLYEDSKHMKRSADAWAQGFRSLAVAPLINEEQIIGGISLRSLKPHAFGVREVHLIERIANQIAGTIAISILRKQQHDLIRKREALEAATAARTEFLSMITHELKTPLTSVTAFSDILARNRNDNLKDRETDQVKVIQRNSRRLQEMIDDLLDLSRMESGRFQLSKAPFSFTEVIDETKEQAASILEARNQRLVVESSGAGVEINGDRSKLIQVLTNLITNASKYSPDGTVIEVAVNVIDRQLCVEVRDDGYGLPDDDIEVLFEAFRRGTGEATAKAPGTGIGLFVSKQIVEGHDGTIALRPRDGNGTIASFTIPVMRMAA
jgi:signal transduction histidine kinase